ncbi:type II toxin-antitoxin system HipA family toxin YjjJ [Ramlibacter sp. GTP1]|uniref:Type II toxin-antitoxin system HipA family toxin YjjJ n=2 Tax=Ramlibacter albus TaxID=2079448 RepID=A0A923M865_9BURK|nr:type II toxin-antitoxin system HipA family toxin YjjJ [Ramlibacter albus]
MRSRDLQEALGVSQPVVSRALAPLLRAGEVLKVGRGRNQAYVMPRGVAGLASALVPVMAVDRDGGVRNFGTLIPVTGGRFWMEEEGGPSQLHGGLPWFVADMRPQGFLGRSFAHAQAALGLAPNPAHWVDDDVLRALCHAGEDLPGNLLVGSASFERYMHATPAAPCAAESYAALAEAAMQGALPGSSAGGEQPKFCCVRPDGCAVIVKFSPSGSSPADLRWADLLACEHLALEALRAAGVPAAVSRLSRAGGRTFLEVERFDRTRQGRIGMVSLLSYDSEYIGMIDNWAAAAGRMQSRGLLDRTDAERLVFMEAFGQLIANTDRHYGNVSLLMAPDDQWRLAPAYDMLPMLYAPVNGEIVAREFDPAALAPSTDTLRAWAAARQAAQSFWQAVSAHEGISSAFREVAASHVLRLEETEGLPRPAAQEQGFQRAAPS